METFLVLSNIGLWIFVAAQLVVVFLLSKLVAQFLNNFRVNQAPAGGAVQPQIVPNVVQVGDLAPAFQEQDQNQKFVRPNDPAGRQTLMVFVRQECAFCEGVVRGLPDLQAAYGGHIRLLVIADERSKVEVLPPEISFLVEPTIFEMYRISKTPTALLIDAQGKIVGVYEGANERQLHAILEGKLQVAATR